MLAPKFSLDFRTGTLNPQVTLTRPGNTATRTNSSGVIEVVNADSARFDYDPVTFAPRGLLIEEQRANLFTHSQQFDNAAWNKDVTGGGVNVSANATTAPDGTLTAEKLTETATTGIHRITQAPTTSATAHSFSVWAKAAERSFIQLRDSTGTVGVWFNLSTGAVGTQSSGITGTIRAFPDGWYRCSVTRTTATTNVVWAISVANADNSNTYAGDGSSGIYIWGAQLEAGASATSYIPTTTAAVTRNADVATITGTAFSGLWRSGPGSLLVRALPSTVSGTRPLVQVDDATADNIIALRGNTTNPELYIRAGGVDQATIDAGTISAAAYRLAGSWKAGNGVATLNGFAPVKGTPASIPATTQMRLGSDGTNYLNGHLQSLEYWDEFFTPATLQSVTTSAGYRSIVGPVMRDTIIA